MPTTLEFPVVTSVGSNDYVPCLVQVGTSYKDRRVAVQNVPDFQAGPTASSALALATSASAQASVAVSTANSASITASNASSAASAATGTAVTALGVANAAAAANTYPSGPSSMAVNDYVHCETNSGTRYKIYPGLLLGNGPAITTAPYTATMPIVHLGANASIQVVDLFTKPVLATESLYTDNFQLTDDPSSFGAQSQIVVLNCSEAAVDTVSGFDGTNTYTPGQAGVYKVTVEATYCAWDTDNATFWVGILRNGIPVDLDFYRQADKMFTFNGTQPSAIVRCESYVTLSAADSIKPFGMFTRQDTSDYFLDHIEVNRVKMLAELICPLASVSSNGVAVESIYSDLRCYFAEDFSNNVIVEWTSSGTGGLGTSQAIAYVKWGNTKAVPFAVVPAGSGVNKQSGTLAPITTPNSPYGVGAYDASTCLVYVVGNLAGFETTPWLVSHLPYGYIV